MSPRAAAEFGKQWPALQRRLTAFLRGKGVPPSEVDDLVQDVAARLVSYWHKIDPDRPLWPLTVTIALNLVRDRGRRPDLEFLGELPDVAGDGDVADASIARIELAAVVRAMDALSPAQKAALLQSIHPEEEATRSTSAEKMLRMRARRRLANAVGRACGGLALKTRRITDSIQGFFSKADAMAQALACATCVFAASTGSVVLSPSVQGFEPGTSPVAVVEPHAVVSTDVPASSIFSTSYATETLSPSRTAGVRTTTNGVAGKASADSQSSGAGGTVTGTPVQNLPMPEAPEVPSDTPVTTAPDAPPAPTAPDQPTEAPDLGGGPVQAPAGDAPVAPVEELTTLLKEKVKR
jgi:DNA-directed RNA polymerase specialized sigma24 family protein